MRTILALLLGGASLVGACGQTAAPGPAPAAAPAQDSMTLSTGGPCAPSAAVADESTMQAHGEAGGYLISATPGALACSEEGPEGMVECAANGPGELHVTAQDTAAWTIPPGQTATLVVGPDGGACYLSVSP